ncbi:MAG: MMPL family transporter [Solirubrobacterales bacterium]|nr:MMPL family transporter [Solirubrobacterales bacterium]
MTAVLYAVARFCTRQRFLVLAAWLLAAFALVAVSQRVGDNTNDNLSLPGSGSQRATDALSKSFPNQANGSSPIVLHVASGKLTDSKHSGAVNEAATDVAKAPYVASVVNPLTSQGASALSKDQSTGYLSVTLSVSPGALSADDAQTIINAAEKPAQAAGIQVETGGQLGQKVSKPSTESSELIGIIAAMVILTFTFGTVVSMLLPILGAILGLAVTLSIIRILSHAMTVSTVAPTLATMIGLGVGIDYALFIVTRHFRGLDQGLELRESIARAAATSGGAVVFAGSTVTIALVSLAVADIPLVTTMGLMAAIAVVVAVLAAVTLLPAMLAIFGSHINSLRVRRRDRPAQQKPGLWSRWANGVARHPVIAGIAAVAILIPLAIPLLSLTLGQKDVAALSTSTTARRAYDLISKNFGPGVNGPLIVAVSLGSPASGTSDSRLTTLEQDVSHTAGVAGITPIQVDKAGTTAYFNAVATNGPADQATADLVGTLRSSVIPSAEKGTNMQAYVGGTTASNVDLASNISSKLPLQILVVIALSFALLVLAFRTLVVPAQAAIMNVLSIGAAYGVLTAIFQFGWLHSLIGLGGSVPIVSYVPLFMFAILFGLSMDYEVFLVSQIEEHVHAGEDNKGSVVKGLITSARVITAAATIMVFVFGGFVLNGDPTVKQFGIGLAVAVILDATIVRCMLVPALMIKMGKLNWYFPAWLDRFVPRISIEGAEFFNRRDRRPEDRLQPQAHPALQTVAVGPDQAGHAAFTQLEAEHVYRVDSDERRAGGRHSPLELLGRGASNGQRRHGLAADREPKAADAEGPGRQPGGPQDHHGQER